ncbi:MAG TPA: GGDEF domain-containing protein [Candidatus Acidoferrales bacterium]|jgi:diguanylate cyclase (GGDEF)-like protein|nr:GGDEF domain-containing protein [Candidatus Acidoferrales bacterium]
MTRPETQSGEPVRTAQTQQIQANMRRIQRRQWWLWSSGVMVILLLGLGIASFALPGLVAQAEDFYSFWLGQTVRGLVALALLFSIYTVYQQLQIHRIQRQLTEQLDALGRMEVRTEEVYKLAILDPLTGLYNRRSGEQRLAEEISRSQRHIKQLTVLLLDLNDLKHVNDRFGHAAGDDLIKYFADRLKRAIRGSDLAVRHGADEFLLLLPECKIEEVQHILDRLSTLRIDFDGQEYVPTFSAGWTNYIPGELPEELLRRADDALYINKRTRKGQDKPTTALA